MAFTVNFPGGQQYMIELRSTWGAHSLNLNVWHGVPVPFLPMNAAEGTSDLRTPFTNPTGGSSVATVTTGGTALGSSATVVLSAAGQPLEIAVDSNGDGNHSEGTIILSRVGGAPHPTIV